MAVVGFLVYDHKGRVRVTYESCSDDLNLDTCPRLPHEWRTWNFVKEFEYHPQFKMPEKGQ